MIKLRTFVIIFSILCYLISQIAKSENQTVILNALTQSFTEGVLRPKFLLNLNELKVIGNQYDKEIEIYQKSGISNKIYVLNTLKILFEDGRIQEGIWILDNFGFYFEAEDFSLSFAEYLQSQSLVTIKYIEGGGASEPQWGRAGQIPLVIKREDQNWVGSMQAESWVYQLDRILGLNIVPLTFLGKINGFDYSAQVVIKNAKDSEIEFRMTNYSEKYPEIFILDFLIQNRDRRSTNSIFSGLGFLVAIDNGHSSAIEDYKQSGVVWKKLYPHYNFSELPRINLVQTIRNIDLQKFEIEFSKYADSEIVRTISDNLKILKNDFNKVSVQEKKSRVPARPIQSHLRLLNNKLLQSSILEEVDPSSNAKALSFQSHSDKKSESQKLPRSRCSQILSKNSKIIL